MRASYLWLPTVLAFSLTSYAADDNNQFAIKGIGLASCEIFLEARQASTPQYHQLGGWLNGYLTATNRYEANTYDLASWQSTAVLTSWLASFCERYPDAQFIQAVTSLVNVLGADRLQSYSEFVKAESEAGIEYVYQETLRRTQEQLVELGYLTESPSGVFDDATMTALMRYQKGSELEPTGLPNQATLIKLLQ